MTTKRVTIALVVLLLLTALVKLPDRAKSVDVSANNEKVAVLSAVQLPTTPFTITLTGPHFLTRRGVFGSVTIRAKLHCDSDVEDLFVTFELEQPGPQHIRKADALNLDCAAGTTTTIFSDLLPGYTLGEATVTATVTDGLEEAVAQETVEILAADDVREMVEARLADPTDLTAYHELLIDLEFRLEHNALFPTALRGAVRESRQPN